MAAPVSPKTMFANLQEEEEEKQDTALEQIADRNEENRPCPECDETISETCFRRRHFNWCTVHERMTGDDGVCPQSPPAGAADNVARCEPGEGNDH